MNPIKQLSAIALSFFASLLIAVPQICSADVVAPGFLGVFNYPSSMITAAIAVYLGLIAIGEFSIKKAFDLPEEKSFLLAFAGNFAAIALGAAWIFAIFSLLPFLGNALGGQLSSSIGDSFPPFFYASLFIVVIMSQGIVLYLFSKKFWRSIIVSAIITALSCAFLFGVSTDDWGLSFDVLILTVVLFAFFFWEIANMFVRNFSPKKKIIIKIVTVLIITCLAVMSLFYVEALERKNEKPRRAKLQSYMDQLRTSATVWSVSQPTSTYIGFDTVDKDGKILVGIIKEISGNDNYKSIVSKDNFCAAAKYAATSNASNTWWCIDSIYGSSGPTTSTDVCTESNPDCL
jgi:hypothetical protein